MDFIKMFTGSNNSGDCDHTKSKLHRRVPSKPEYKIRMPGIGTAISISGKMPDFIYHCPNCSKDLPVKNNPHWEILYNSYRTPVQTQ